MIVGVNVRTFDDLPASVNIQDVEIYANGRFKMTGIEFLNRLIGGLGVRKVTQAPQVYSGTLVAVTIDINDGEDWEVYRNGVLQWNYIYDVSGTGKVTNVQFSPDYELDAEQVSIVKREIYKKI